MGSPAWLGIGAQRSGTTWFTGLLTQHPLVDLGINGKKEQQLLHKVADGRESASAYLDLFPDDGYRRGECSPQYLRHPYAGLAATDLLDPDVPILVLLRDPVERYRSAMRLSATRGRSQPYPIPINVQTWAGCYADQLDLWASFVGRERLTVMIYEEILEDPEAAVHGIWKAMDLEPVELEHVHKPSRTSSQAEWDWPAGAREALRDLYRRQADRLSAEWDLPVERWKSLA